MNTEDRGVRLDQFMVGIKWMLGLLGVLAILSFIVTLGSIADSRKQSAEAMVEIKKQLDDLKVQNAVLADQNKSSQADRHSINQRQGQLEERQEEIQAVVKDLGAKVKGASK